MTRGQRRVRSVPRRRAGRLSAAVVVGAALALVATTVPAAAVGGGGSVHATASTYPDSEGIVLDAWGGLHVFTYGSTPAKITSFGGAPYWPGWDIARGVALRNTNLTTCTAFGGYTLDAWGGLHPFGIDGAGAPAKPTDGPYWKGWDIARDVVLVPQFPAQADSAPAGGLVLDGFGGLHYFTIVPGVPAPVITGGPYWNGWDIARGVMLVTDSTGWRGGYVVDAWGGLHPFGVNGTTPPAVDPSTVSYWPGWQIVRSGTVFRNAAGVTNNLPNGGFTLDAWGGLHGFAFTGQTPPVTSGLHNAPYWSGWNIARGLVMRNIRTC